MATGFIVFYELLLAFLGFIGVLGVLMFSEA